VSHSSRVMPSLRVMTYNIRNGRGSDQRVDLGRIGDVIIGYGPDVVALQEVDVGRARSGGADQAAELATRLGMHARFVGCVERGCERYGIATLSRWPIEESRTVMLPHRPETEPRAALCLWVRWPAAERRLELINTHLSTNGVERVEQVAALSAEIGTGDVVLAGDLNCSAASTPYRSLCTTLRAVTKARTWPARFPLFQLDHLLYRGALRLVSSGVWSRAPARRASDHLPVVAELEALP
jgi:endonuclease/exonuclease/phosphatase family metal-dependent hydrolase